MRSLSVAGGVYYEKASWPRWREVYGSGGRAATALGNGNIEITLHTYATERTKQIFEPYATAFQVDLNCAPALQDIEFYYFDCLSEPEIHPGIHNIKINSPFRVEAEHVLRFGMLEGSAIIDSNLCVYDPQCPFDPQPFNANGSRCSQLAIVGNISEIKLLGQSDNTTTAAQNLLDAGAKVVVTKRGPDGAEVTTPSASPSVVPAFVSTDVWTLGSGDVFSAAFAAAWAIEGRAAAEAAYEASKAVSYYANSRSVPCYPIPKSISIEAAQKAINSVYLAGPFFSASQLWLIERAKKAFEEMGVAVFSPYHRVGKGKAKDVAQKDLDGLRAADTVFAIIDGLDAGTIFEIGYARAMQKPVWILAQSVEARDLTMIVGSDCIVIDDFVSAVYRTVWQK